jgi:tetratricopeptide (TPR) repeat protein
MEAATEKNNKGVEFLLKKDFERAESAFKDALGKDDKNTTALNNMGLLYHQKEEYKKAIQHFNNAISIHAKDTYYLNLANSLTFLGKYDEAETNYKACLSLNLDNANAKISLAKLYEKVGKARLATVIWEELANSSTKEFYKSELAKNYMATGNFENALSVLTYLISINENALYRCYIGVCEFNLKNYGLAELAFKKSLAVEPDNYKTRHYLAINYLSKGDYNDALKQLELLIKMNPDDNKVKLDKAIIFLNLGNYKEAQKLIDQVLKTDSENEKALYYKSVLAGQNKS